MAIVQSLMLAMYCELAQWVSAVIGGSPWMYVRLNVELYPEGG